MKSTESSVDLYAEITKLWDEQQAAELEGRPDLAARKAAEIDERLDRLPRPR